MTVNLNPIVAWLGPTRLPSDGLHRANAISDTSEQLERKRGQEAEVQFSGMFASLSVRGNLLSWASVPRGVSTNWLAFSEL